MVTLSTRRFAHPSSRFTYRHAEGIARRASRGAPGVVFVDLDGVTDTTTAALARLVVLRGKLLSGGGDLMISGIGGKARNLYAVLRFDKLLPMDAAL